MKIDKWFCGWVLLIVSWIPSNSWSASLGELMCETQLTLPSGALIRPLNLGIGPLEGAQVRNPIVPDICPEGFLIPLETLAHDALSEIKPLTVTSSQFQGHVELYFELLYGETLGTDTQLMAKITLTHWNAEVTEKWARATVVSPLVMGTRVFLDFSSPQGGLDHVSLICRMFPK